VVSSKNHRSFFDRRWFKEDQFLAKQMVNFSSLHDDLEACRGIPPPIDRARRVIAKMTWSILGGESSSWRGLAGNHEFFREIVTVL
jgi:hypothetical protein